VVQAVGLVGGLAAPDHLARGVQHLQRGGGRIGGQLIAPAGLAVLEAGGGPDGGGVLADILGGAGQAVALLGAEQAGQQVVGQKLLLDAGHLGQLGGEFVGIDRRQRILVLQLGGQQRQEGLERSEEHTSELQSRENLVCRLLLEK